MKLIIETSEYNKEWITNAYSIPQEIMLEIAEAIINGTELIRCEDCMYGMECMKDGYMVCSVMTNPNYVPIDHFCGYGERKEE